MVSIVAPKLPLNNDKQENTDGLNQPLFICTIPVNKAGLTPETFSLDTRATHQDTHSDSLILNGAMLSVIGVVGSNED